MGAAIGAVISARVIEHRFKPITSGRTQDVMETYKEFTFEAAHRTEPFEGLHGHSFRVRVSMTGPSDPIYGWSHNLYAVEESIAAVRKLVDHRYLNDIEGLSVPTIENVAIWLWGQLTSRLTGIDRVEVSRGSEGHAEGCVYRGTAQVLGSSAGTADPTFDPRNGFAS
jgi:6-pyruvoyltetrahydropterin/6-carboxytetrahydropterin synthase